MCRGKYSYTKGCTENIASVLPGITLIHILMVLLSSNAHADNGNESFYRQQQFYESLKSDTNLKLSEQEITENLVYYSGRNNSYEIISILIRMGADVNKSDKHQQYALIRAAAGDYGNGQGNTQVGLLLLSSGANPNAVDKDENSALIHAAYGRSYELVKALIAKGADVNAVNKEGVTPLLAATRGNAGTNNHRIVKLLLENGAAHDARRKLDYLRGELMYETPLRNAVRKGDRESARALIEHYHARGLTYEPKDGSLRRLAGLNNDWGMIAILDEADASAPYSDGDLYQAVLYGDRDYLTRTIEFGVDLNSDLAKKSLTTAFNTKQFDLAKVILDTGIDMNAKYRFSDDYNENLLVYYIQYANDEAVEMLLEHGADMKPEAASSLFRSVDNIVSYAVVEIACYPGDAPINIINSLIRHGADPTIADKNGLDAFKWLQISAVSRCASKENAFRVRDILSSYIENHKAGEQ